MAKDKHRKGFFTIIKVIVVAVNIPVALFTVFSAYGGAMDPTTSSSGAIAAMLFPVALVLTLLFMFASLLWSAKAALANLLVIVACWNPVWTLCPLNLFRDNPDKLAAEGDAILKVLSYNTFGLDDFSHKEDADSNRTIQYIIDADADIVLCQEFMAELRSGVKGITDGQVKAVVGKYPYRHIDSRGMCIFSKYPFEKIPLHYGDSYKFDVCRYDVSIGHRLFHVFNLHLQSIGLTSEDKRLYRHITEGGSDTDDIDNIRHGLIDKLSAAFCERAKQAEVVRQAVDSAGEGNVILSGDFNDIPLCYAARVIAGDDLVDVYSEAGLGPQISYHADRFYFRIDQMYVRGCLRPLRARCGGSDSSDHYPFTAWFELTDNQ